MIRVIETERLILRPWKESDIEAIIEGFSDFDTAKMLTIPYPYTREDVYSFLEEREKDDNDSFYFAIALKGSDQAIGGTNLRIESNGLNSGGIWIDKKYQGFGYGTEAWIARAKFAFFDLGLDELYNGYYIHNEASPKMQMKIGYQIIGETERYCPALGEVVKVVEA